MGERLIRAFLGVFGFSADESPRFYVDVFFGALAGLALLAVSMLVLSRQYNWLFYVAIAVGVLCICIASNKHEVAAGALLIVASRFLFAFLISFRLSALVGALFCAVIAILLLRLTGMRPGRPRFLPPRRGLNTAALCVFCGKGNAGHIRSFDGTHSDH